METTLDIFIKSIFSENMIFAYFLGMCSYLAVSKTVKTAVGLGAAVVFVLVVTVPLNWLLENYFRSFEHNSKHIPCNLLDYQIHLLQD